MHELVQNRIPLPQLEAMNTKRLLRLYRSVRVQVAGAESNCIDHDGDGWSEPGQHAFDVRDAYRAYQAQIKAILDKREHVEERRRGY